MFAIAHMYYRIAFESKTVAIMEDIAVEFFCIYPKIADAQIFKYKSEGLQVGDKVLGTDTKGSYGYWWVDKISGVACADSGFASKSLFTF